MTSVTVVIGAGSIGQAIARRVSSGKHVLLEEFGNVIALLAKDELTGPCGEGYRRMIDLSPVGRAGTPDEIASLAALLMGPEGAFITGSDFLIDGGVTASYFYGDLQPK